MNSSVEYLDCGGADFSYCGSPNPGQSGAILADNISGLRDIGSSITSSEVRLESSHLGSFSAADPSVTSKSGFDFEIQLEEPEDDDGMDIGMGGWVVKICKAAVREPVSNYESFGYLSFILWLSLTCDVLMLRVSGSSIMHCCLFSRFFMKYMRWF